MKAVLLVYLCADAYTMRHSNAEESNVMKNVAFLQLLTFALQCLNKGN